MATLSQITLTHAAGTLPNTRQVTVTGTMHFDATEVGKAYRLEIKLLGEDKPGDKLPAGDAPGDDLLYTFSWGPGFPKKPFTQLTVAAAGALPFSETRTLAVSKLDEDSGKVKIGEASINDPIFAPRKDEAYARVTLAGAPVSERSPTVIVGDIVGV